MIGFFDSGFGGLTVLRETVKLLPNYSYIYLGDNLRTPYGTRSQEEIFKFTRQGVEYLFSQGAQLVILACNTSSASALRLIQQEIIPLKYPNKKVLGIIIPTAEELGKFTQSGCVGILATPATIGSKAYQREINKFWPKLKVYQQACPELVPLIEVGELGKKLDEAIKKYLDNLFEQSKTIDALLLGCTHYAIIENKIQKMIPSGKKIISQGPIIARKIQDYLERHPEIETKLNRRKERLFLSTANSEKIKKLGQLFYGEAIEISLAEIK